MSEPVHIEINHCMMEITLDRPKANAIDSATSRALGDAFARFRDDDDLRVAIITGAGDRIFSAGWDLKAAASGAETADQGYGPGGFAGLTEMFDLPKPVIAAVNGHAIGGGLELVLAADIIVAAEHVEMWLPEATLGILPDAGGVLRLPRRIPYNVAMEMLLTGRRMGALEAKRWGLVNEVASSAELLDRARAYASRIAATAPLSAAAIKEILRETADLTVEQGYRHMRSGAIPVYQRMLASEDALEGPRAFAQKRSPRWKGR